MEKPGRNDPCPCGSGRKYKNCCLKNDAGMSKVKTSASEQKNSGKPTAPRGGLDIHPYAIVKMVTNPSPDVLATLSKRQIAALKDKWTITKIASLKTSDIVARLERLGIDGSRSAFVALTAGRTSAWSIGNDWVDGLSVPVAMDDEDFICLAACELWKRYCPERPSMEMVDDWVTEGYDLSEAAGDAKAADVWFRVWEVVRPRLAPHVATFDGADTVFKVSQFFGNWIQDFTLALENAAVSDPRYADIGIRLTREILERFVDESTDTVLNFRCDLGRFLFLANRREEGEATFQAIIREYPDQACGYVVLSDQLGLFAHGRLDYPHAIALLEQALAQPVEDAADWDIEARLADLRVKNEQHGRRGTTDLMRKPCPVCGKRKAQRRCKRRALGEICTLCCVEMRDAACVGCTHYTTAQQYHAARGTPARLSDKHFIAEINPEIERAVNTAMELAQKGKMDQALAAVTSLLREHPRNHTVCYGMGTLHAIKGEHKEAIKWFDKAIAIYPYFAEAHFNKAVAYQKLLDVGNAIRAYRKVVEVGDPNDTPAKQARSFLEGMAATIRRNEGVDLDTYLESEDQFNRAFSLMKRGDWSGAVAGFRASAAKNDRNAPTHGNMGLCLAKLGHKAQALAEFDRALEIDPGYEPAISNRVAVERMEEGRPMDTAAMQRVEFSKERFLQKQNRSRSLLRPLAALFRKRSRRAASGPGATFGRKRSV